VVPSQEMTRPEMARPPAPTEAPAAIKQEEENDDESSYASLLVPIVNPQPALNSHNRSNPSITRGGKNL